MTFLAIRVKTRTTRRFATTSVVWMAVTLAAAMSSLFAQPPAPPAAAPPAAAPPAAAPPTTAMPEDATALLARLYAQLQAARQSLRDADTGTNTRAAQRSAVSLFDQLIAAAERDEAEQSKGASAAEAGGAPRPQAAPDSPESKPESDTPPELRPRRPDTGQPAAWGRLRDRQRDEVMGSIPGPPLPARYRALVDQYFESFQHDRR